MFKNQKGITLIALVITIIVLLILAGITIALIAGQNSAPEKAGEGRARTAIGAAKDAINMQASTNIATYYDEKYVKNYTENGTGTPATNKLTWTSEQAAAAAAGTQSTATNTPVGSTAAVDGVSFSCTDNTITVTYTAEAKYTATGEVQVGGTIKWTDNTAANS